MLFMKGGYFEEFKYKTSYFTLFHDLLMPSVWNLNVVSHENESQDTRFKRCIHTFDWQCHLPGANAKAIPGVDATANKMLICCRYKKTFNLRKLQRCFSSNVVNTVSLQSNYHYKSIQCRDELHVCS